MTLAARDWLEHFREAGNPQTAGERWERWEYLDQAAVHVEELLAVCDDAADRLSRSACLDVTQPIINLLREGRPYGHLTEEEFVRRTFARHIGGEQ